MDYHGIAWEVCRRPWEVNEIPWGVGGIPRDASGYSGTYREKSVGYRGCRDRFGGIPWDTVGSWKDTVYTVGYRGNSLEYCVIPWDTVGSRWDTVKPYTLRDNEASLLAALRSQWDTVKPYVLLLGVSFSFFSLYYPIHMSSLFFFLSVLRNSTRSSDPGSHT